MQLHDDRIDTVLSAAAGCETCSGSRLQQCLVVDRGVRHQPLWPMEIPAVLQSGQCVLVGLGSGRIHTRDMARIGRASKSLRHDCTKDIGTVKFVMKGGR